MAGFFRLILVSEGNIKTNCKKSKLLLPPAWMMQSLSDLLTLLSKIIGYSDNESRSSSK
ncbi:MULTISPECIES: lysis system o-spanin lipoprotein Rz1 [unclassified Providencia]|uniref:lysis system o-spanin lipoprotein Rz1 n=1 Tax=unclassified Providencia TaxID=2633465 RepID=UPI003FA7019E